MNTPTLNETLCGGGKYEASFLDGTKSEVAIKQLPVRKMQDYALAQGDECKMIELATGLEPARVDLLTSDSHAGLLAEVERINTDFFLQWAARMKARAERIKGIGAPATAAS